MKTSALLLFFLGGILGAPAQAILFKNGDTVAATDLVRDGDMVKTSVKTSTGRMGQVGYHVSDIAELSLPEPQVMPYATEQVSRADYIHALGQIEPVVAYQKTIRDIPGNWWAKAALVEVLALSGLNRIDDATALVNDIAANSKDPEILTSAKLQIILNTKYADSQQALDAYSAIIHQSNDARTLSLALVAKAGIHMERHEFDEALMDYLTVPVFYPEHNMLLPKALWGSGQAYAKLKDMANAGKAYHALIDSYPNSPEAALAKAELKKKEKKP